MDTGDQTGTRFGTQLRMRQALWRVYGGAAVLGAVAFVAPLIWLVRAAAGKRVPALSALDDVPPRTERC